MRFLRIWEEHTWINPWNKFLQVPGSLLETCQPLLASSLPPTQPPFSIILPFLRPLAPSGRGSVSPVHIVCCNTLAAIWPPPSLPTSSCPGMIMSSFRTPCFDRLWIYSLGKVRQRVKEREGSCRNDGIHEHGAKVIIGHSNGKWCCKDDGDRDNECPKYTDSAQTNGKKVTQWTYEREREREDDVTVFCQTAVSWPPGYFLLTCSLSSQFFVVLVESIFYFLTDWSLSWLCDWWSLVMFYTIQLITGQTDLLNVIFTMFQLLKREHFQLHFVLKDCKFNIFELWTIA